MTLIDAIKEVRAASGIGLKEAKNAVERLHNLGILKVTAFGEEPKKPTKVYLESQGRKIRISAICCSNCDHENEMPENITFQDDRRE